MKIFKNILAGACLTLLPAAAMAQNGSNSSYSRFGLGTLTDQAQTFNRGMSGVAYGLRGGKYVNMQNPASYSSIDSLTFLFDVGMSLQAGQYSVGGTNTNVRNTTLTNVNAGFRIRRNLGMSFGFAPFSTIGYTFNTTSTVGASNTSSHPVTTSTQYTGSGGLNQVYVGAGWKPFANLSIGANISYLWGNYQHSISQSFYEGSTASSDFSNQNLSYSATLGSYKLDFGIQYPIRITRQDWVTIGATYGLGHQLSGDASQLHFTSAGDSTEIIAKNAFDLPHSIGAGLSWRHKDQLLVAADATYEKWADCKSAISTPNGNGVPTYTSTTGAYMNRTRVALGVEFTPAGADKSRPYWETIRYRAGLNYSTPYLKVNNQDGPKEMGVSFGLGLPLQSRKLSGRSVINISAEWKQRNPSVSNMIKENYFILNIGVTFNENWFSQWKID